MENVQYKTKKEMTNFYVHREKLYKTVSEDWLS